jgi:chromosome segregation ATPase
VAADGKDAVPVVGVVCPRCGVGLEADITLRVALDERAEAAKARLEEAERRALDAQRELEVMHTRCAASEASARELQAALRDGQDQRAQMEVELKKLLVAAAGAR